MIPESIKQAAKNLWMQGVTSFYIIISPEENIFNKERELALIEMLNDLGFRWISSRRILHKYNRIMGDNHVSKMCFIDIISSSAVIIADGCDNNNTCLLEIMIAKHAGKHLLNEFLFPADRFNSLEIKFSSNETTV